MIPEDLRYSSALHIRDVLKSPEVADELARTTNPALNLSDPVASQKAVGVSEVAGRLRDDTALLDRLVSESTRMQTLRATLASVHSALSVSAAAQSTA